MLGAGQEQGRRPRTLCRGHNGDIPFPRSPPGGGTQLQHHQALGAAGSQVLGCPLLVLAEVAGQGGARQDQRWALRARHPMQHPPAPSGRGQPEVWLPLADRAGSGVNAFKIPPRS